MTDGPEFIPQSGACLATKNVLNGHGTVRWMVREPSKAPADNGWRILSDLDTTESMAAENPWEITSFNRLCEIEPALICIYDFPVGSDLALVRDKNGLHIVDLNSGREVPREDFYVPPQHRI